MGSPTTLAIAELTGEEHTLELFGRALPYQGLAFEGSMRAEFTWYPGCPQATVQVLGPEEGATSIDGMWKDRFIKNETDPINDPYTGVNIPAVPVDNVQGRALYDGNYIRDVSSLVSAMDGFRRRGQLVKVTWDAITRVGLLTKFRHKWIRREDVEWECEFTWMSQGEDPVPITFGQTNSISDLANAIADAVAALVEAVQAVFALVDSVMNMINNAIDMIVEAVASIAALVQQAIGLVMLPFEIANKLVAAYDTVAKACTDIADAVTSLPSQVMNAAVDLAGASEPDALVVEQYKREVKVQAKNTQVEAVMAKHEVLSHTDQQPAVSVVQARQDEDLRTVSTRQFRTQNEWRRLKRYNRLRSSRLTGGRKLLVPAVQVPVQGARRG